MWYRQHLMWSAVILQLAFPCSSQHGYQGHRLKTLLPLSQSFTQHCAVTPHFTQSKRQRAFRRLQDLDF